MIERICHLRAAGATIACVLPQSSFTNFRPLEIILRKLGVAREAGAMSRDEAQLKEL